MVVAVCVKAAHDGYLWQFWHVVGYAAGLVTWEDGLSDRWHTEQFVIIEVWLTVTVAQTGYLWQFSQTVG